MAIHRKWRWVNLRYELARNVLSYWPNHIASNDFCVIILGGWVAWKMNRSLLQQERVVMGGAG